MSTTAKKAAAPAKKKPASATKWDVTGHRRHTNSDIRHASPASHGKGESKGWMAQCVTHKVVTFNPTRTGSWELAKRPEGWCHECKKAAAQIAKEGPVKKAKPPAVKKAPAAKKAAAPAAKKAAPAKPAPAAKAPAKKAAPVKTPAKKGAGTPAKK